MVQIIDWIKASFSYQSDTPILVASYRIKWYKDDFYRLRVQVEGNPGNYPWGMQIDTNPQSIEQLRPAFAFFNPILVGFNNNGELFSPCYLTTQYYRSMGVRFGWYNDEDNPPEKGFKIPVKAVEWLRAEISPRVKARQIEKERQKAEAKKKASEAGL